MQAGATVMQAGATVMQAGATVMHDGATVMKVAVMKLAVRKSMVWKASVPHGKNGDFVVPVKMPPPQVPEACYGGSFS